MTSAIPNLTVLNQSQLYHFDQVEDSDFHGMENLENCPAMPMESAPKFHEIKDLEIADQKIQELFPQTLLSKIAEEFTAPNVTKVVLPILLGGVCVFQRENVTNLLGHAFQAFRGEYGLVAPVLMSSAYLALKYMDYSNQKTEGQEPSYTSRVYSWLKAIPENFALGANYLPHALRLSISIAVISNLLSKTLSVNSDSSPAYVEALNKASLFDLAVQAPFLEELFFREVIQGSCVSAMKLVNAARLRQGQDIAFTDETISKTSRVFSAVTFGMVHSNQSIIQAACAGVTAYHYATWLYEKNGFFASFGLHFANNLFAGLLLKALQGAVKGNNNISFSNSTAA